MKIPRIHLALVALQGGLALASLVLDLAGGCGACRKSGGPRLAIAFAGCAAYLVLFLAGWRGWRRPFYSGVFLAAGVHTALGAVLVLRRAPCVPCIASAIVSLVLAGHALMGRAVPAGTARLAWPAAFVLTLVALAPGLAAAPVPEKVARAPRPGIRLDVYELARCPYCREFRERFHPRIAEEYGDRVEVAFHDAALVPWVERAPTLVIDGGAVFDGLPLRYEHLRDALEARLSKEVRP